MLFSNVIGEKTLGSWRELREKNSSVPVVMSCVICVMGLQGDLMNLQSFWEEQSSNNGLFVYYCNPVYVMCCFSFCLNTFPLSCCHQNDTLLYMYTSLEKLIFNLF